jgi:uncharacterized protein YyaL (SSP411 family)
MRALVAFLALLSGAFAAQIDWSDSYAAACRKAAETHKNVLLLITTESCGWCRRLERTTLREDAVVAKINANFVAVHVTRGRDDYPKSLKAKMVPMSYFLHPDGSVFYRMPGYWTSEDYLSILHDAEKKAAKSAPNKEKQQ